VQTRRFFAHVRATTGTAVTRTNCHPFTWKNWAFMHNGQIGNWADCRKDIESQISSEHYAHRQGSTDSEALFLLALSYGLATDPVGAMTRAIQTSIDTMNRHSAAEPFRATIAITDGQSVWAFRHSSDGHAPSLYFGSPRTRASEQGDNPVNTIASEPLDSQSDDWQSVEEGTVLHWTDARLVQERLAV